MLRSLVLHASRMCEPVLFEALRSQQSAGMTRTAAAQTLVSLRRFSTEGSSPFSPGEPGAAAGVAAGSTSPKGVQQWRQWVDAKIGEKLDGKADEAPAQPADLEPAPASAPAAAAAEAESAGEAGKPSAVAAEQQHLQQPPLQPLWPPHERPAAVERELQDLLQPVSRRQWRSVQEEIFEIVVPPSLDEAEPGQGDSRLMYKQLAQAREAPRLFPGGSNKAEEMSPDRIHPYRLFYPGQLYAPQDLDPYQAKEALPESSAAAAARRVHISQREVEARADFRDAQFLTSFVSEAGKLVPRRRTRLQQKLHRHLCRQIKVARMMAILPPDARLPHFQPRRRAPRSP